MTRVLFRFIFSLTILFSASQSQSQILNTDPGPWSLSSTWGGGPVPGINDTAQLQDGLLLFVNSNFNVHEVWLNFASNASGPPPTFVIGTGNTLNITNDLNILAPVNSGRSVTIIVTGTLNIGGDLNIQFGSTLQDSATVTIQVNGNLNITGNIVHSSSAACTNNVINLDVNAGSTFTAGNVTYDFNGADSRLVADIAGSWTSGNITGHLRKADSRFIVNLNTGGSLSAGNINLTSYSTQDNIIINTASGTSISGSTNTLIMDCRGANSNIEFNHSGSLIMGQSTFLSRNSNDTIDFNLFSGSFYYLNGVNRILGISTSQDYININQDQNSTMRVTPYFDIESGTNGILDMDMDGTFSGGYFDFDLRNASTVNVNFNTNSNVSAKAFRMHEYGNSSSVDISFNGIFSCSGDFNTAAKTNSQFNFAFNQPTIIDGDYIQSTSGSGAGIKTDVFSSLVVNELVQSIASGASAGDNEMDIDHSNAVLQFERINNSFAGTLTAGTSNNSTVVYAGSAVGDSILTRSGISYDNLTINKTSSITLNGPLQNSNFNGDLVINSGASLLLGGNSALTVNGDLINSGTLNSQGNSFTLLGNFNNNGSYVSLSQDTLYFRGSANQAITGGNVFQHMLLDNANGATISGGSSIAVQNSLSIESGTLTTNNSLTFLSNSTNTAALAPMPASGASISGGATVERLLNESGSAFWYMIGTPTTGSTLQDWNNELFMGGFTGSNNPGWGPTVYRFDNSSISVNGDYTEGYTAPTNVTNTVSSGQGWMVWVGSSPKTVNSIGPLTVGNKTVNLDFNTNPLLASERGWNLVSNPYPARIHWPSVGTTLVPTGEAYISKADGNYFAVNADNVYNINSSEAFWVQTTGSGSLSFTESNKIMLPDSFNFKMQGPVFTKPLKMMLTQASSTSYSDYSVLRFGGDSNSVDFDNIPGEAAKVANSFGDRPNIASYSNNGQRDIYYNTLNPQDSNMIIPLKVWKTYPQNKNETYTIDFENIITWSNDNHCIILKDSLNNKSQKVDDVNHHYTWTVYDTVKSIYLYLEHSIPLQVSFEAATCYGYNDGSASVKGLDNLNHTYVWFDENHNIILRENNISGTSSINNLSAGTYLVMVDNNGDCGTMGVTIIIEEPDPVIASFNADRDTLYMNASTNVVFNNTSENANDYHWDFGDGNTSDVKDPDHTYIGAGSYQVQLIAENDPCSDTLSKSIVVVDNVGVDHSDRISSDIKIYQQNGETYVEFNLMSSADVQINMYDVMGRKIMESISIMNVGIRKVRLNIPENLTGVYNINVTGDDINHTEKLFYQN